MVLDTNGDGRITKPWNEPPTGTNAPVVDPKLDTRVTLGTYAYGVVSNPVDDSAWAVSDDFPGDGVRWIRRQVGIDAVVVNGEVTWSADGGYAASVPLAQAG